MSDGTALRIAFDSAGGDGQALFVPYVTAGLPSVDAALLRGLVAAGADAIEVGVPFSDPIMDGGVIQKASEIALAAGFHPRDAFALVAEAKVNVPVLLMTYYNPILAMGENAWIAAALEAGVAGFIVPDLPVDESAAFATSCAQAGLALVYLAAPGASEERLAMIAEASTGFIYCVAAYGVTGAREDLGSTAQDLVASLRSITDKALLVGVGITTPEHAKAAVAFADGVIVGSAIVRALIEDGSDGALKVAKGFKEAVDQR